MIDKILLKFIADVLYLKGFLCAEELEDIYEVQTFSDLDKVFEKMIGGEYNVYKRGEQYWRIDGRARAGIFIGDNDASNEDAEVHPSVHDGAVQLK